MLASLGPIFNIGVDKRRDVAVSSNAARSVAAAEGHVFAAGLLGTVHRRDYVADALDLSRLASRRPSFTRTPSRIVSAM